MRLPKEKHPLLEEANNAYLLGVSENGDRTPPRLLRGQSAFAPMKERVSFSHTALGPLPIGLSHRQAPSPLCGGAVERFTHHGPASNRIGGKRTPRQTLCVQHGMTRRVYRVFPESHTKQRAFCERSHLEQ